MSQGSGERYFQSAVDLASAESGSESVVQRERANSNRLAKFVPEGIEGRVPYRGPLESMVFPARRRPALRHGLPGLPNIGSCKRGRSLCASAEPACARATCTT